MGKAISAPKCKICGVEHWATESHKWQSEADADEHVSRVARVVGKLAETVPLADKDKDALIAQLRAALALSEAREAKRKAQTRDRVRKVRAK